MTTTHPAIEQAKASFLQSKEALKGAFANTPDARVNWSPAATARTPAQQVAHAAEAIGHIQSQLAGTPLAWLTTEDMDRHFRQNELRITSREQALDLLEQNSAAYVAWLDSLAPDDLSRLAQMPFGLGHCPVSIGLTFAPDHMRWHTAQIEYMQTIYGDRDWHL